MKSKIAAIIITAICTSVIASPDITDQIVMGIGPETYEASQEVVRLKYNAFGHNHGIRVARFPNVTEVEVHAFRGCLNLEELYLPRLESVKNLSGTFAFCNRLRLVDLSSITFNEEIKAGSGFPWGAPNPEIRFVFKNGTFNRLGKRIE